MRYIAEKAISFSMMVKGRADSVRVSFTSLSTGGSTYSTEEENIIEAMEKSPMYGKFYHRAPECMNDSIKAKKATRATTFKKKPIEVTSVENWQEAVEYLVEQCGSNGDKLFAPEDILREAEAKGVSFPRLN